jgi:hypothetical protein
MNTTNNSNSKDFPFETVPELPLMFPNEQLIVIKQQDISELFCPKCHRGIEFRLQLQTLNVTAHRDPNAHNKQSSSVCVSPTGTGENHKITCPNCNKMILFAWRTSAGTQLPKPENPGQDVVTLGLEHSMFTKAEEMWGPSHNGFIEINQDNIDKEDRDMKRKASK